MELDDKIQRKDYKEKEFKSLIVNFIQSKKEKSGVKITDIVVGTGLSKDWVAYTTHQLLSDYPARLDTNEEGDLLYIFDFEQKQTSFRQKIYQILEVILQSLWKIFMWIFKVWIVLMLVTYLLFNTLILAIAITIITRSGEVAQGFIRALFTIASEIYAFITQKSSKQGALHQVFAYVFGEKQTPKDDLFLEKIILEFIQQNKGMILASDVVKITGWSLRKAEQEMAQLLANYHGEVEVTENGVIVYHFEDLEKAESTKNYKQFESWHRPLPIPYLNYNEAKTNIRIAGVNTFNIIAPFLSASLIAFFFEFGGFWNLPQTWFFYLITFPVSFSLLFFLIPLLRLPFMKQKQKKVEKLNERFEFLRFIFENITKKVYPKERYKDEKALKHFEEVALELSPEIVLNEQGVSYQFEQLEAESNTIKH